MLVYRGVYIYIIFPSCYCVQLALETWKLASTHTPTPQPSTESQPAILAAGGT